MKLLRIETAEQLHRKWVCVCVSHERYIVYGCSELKRYYQIVSIEMILWGRVRVSLCYEFFRLHGMYSGFLFSHYQIPDWRHQVSPWPTLTLTLSRRCTYVTCVCVCATHGTANEPLIPALPMLSPSLSFLSFLESTPWFDHTPLQTEW